MFKKFSFWIFIVVCLAGIIYWLKYINDVKTPVSDGINAIPSSAAIIFESKQAQNVWKKLSETNIMWEELLGLEPFSQLNSNARAIDSLLNQNEAISKLLDNHSLFISAHPLKEKGFDFLFVYSLPNITYQNSIGDFINSVNKGKEPIRKDYAGTEVVTIITTGKDSLNYCFINGNLVMSKKEILIEESIRQLKSGTSLMKYHSFNKIISSSGKNAEVNLYVNYKRFPQLLHPFFFPTVQKETNALANFADYSGWDITIKPNALLMNGFTEANDTTNTFLNLFSKQKPQEINQTKVIPYSTAILLFYGISNINSFNSDYKKYLKTNNRLQDYELYTREINHKYNVNIEQSMFDWINNEMALVIAEPSDNDFTNNSYAVIGSNTIENAATSLNDLTDSINKTERIKRDSVHFGKYIITHLPLKNVLANLFGWQFNKVTEDYYTSIDNYIVFANSYDALKYFINQYEYNKTLSNDKNYKTFSENISNEANIYLYTSIARSVNIYSSFLTEQLAKEMESKSELFKKFEATAIQFSSSDKSFYSSAYLKYNPDTKQENTTLWETKLDTTVSSKPYLVVNHNTKGKEVLVQDDENKIYLISNTGKILWRKQLNEKIMSDVIQVDILKNDKLQLLFNTQTAIYLFDRNGDAVKGFPIKLKSSATNALSVVDYEKNRDYRLFIATENKDILCYNAKGEKVEGFKCEKTANIVFLPVQYFRANDKDHLCAVDAKGKVYILTRHGETRVKMKEQLNKGINNFFVEVGKDYSKTYIIAADTLGNVTKLSLSNDKENIKFQSFETSPYFDYKDINNDKTNEYIFLTRNQLKVFSQDKSLLFNYDFKDTIMQAPQVFSFPDGTGKIGVVSESSNQIYLFDNNGSLHEGFPLTGKTLYSIGDMNNDGTLNVVTGSKDKSIYVYPLK